MKIFGTGKNFYGVVTAGEIWKSAGNPPHWLVFDTGGREASLFEGISFNGQFNINQITIYIKKGEQYIDKIVLTNIDLTNGFIATRLNMSQGNSTNLI